MHAQHYPGRKWRDGGRNEHNAEWTTYVYVKLITCYNIASTVLPDVRIYRHMYTFFDLWKKSTDFCADFRENTDFFWFSWKVNIPFGLFWSNADLFLKFGFLIESISLSTSEVELGAPKICQVWNTIMHWNGKVHFRAKHCKKYWLDRKMLQTKVKKN